MSVEIGSAYVTLIPSMKGFSAKAESALASSGIGSAFTRATTKDAESAGASAGGLFSRGFSKYQKGAGSGIYVAGLLRNLRTYGYALSGVIGLTVGLGLKTASAFEQAKVAFTTVLGSASKAKALFSQLVQFAKTTPFNLPNVVSATQQLLAYGFTAKQTIPILTSLGDAASGLSLGNEGLGRLILAIGQIRAKGRVQAQEVLQLTNAGVPALRILGNAFGVTTGQLQKYMQKGLIPANKAIAALLNGLETGTKGVNGATAKFGGLMAKQAKTLGGLFSNLRDAISIGLAKAVGPLVPVLEHALPHATNAIARALRAASGALAEFLHGLGVTKDKSKGVTTGFEQAGSAVRLVAHVLATVGKFIGRNIGLFTRLTIAVLAAAAASKVLALAMFVVDAVMDANPVGLIVLGIEALVAAFVYAYTTSKTFRDVVRDVFHVLERVAGEWVQINVGAFKFVFDAMTSFVGGMIHLAASAFGWIPGIGGKLKGAAKAFDGFRSDVDSTLSRIATDASGWGERAGSNFNSAFTNAAGFGTGKNSPFRDPGHPGSANAKAATHAGAVTGANIGNGIATGLGKSGSKVAKSTADLVNKILGPLRALRDQARQLAQSVAQSVLGDTGFGAILNATDAFGQTGFGTSVGAIIRGFEAQRRDVLHFRNELRLLEKRGLSPAEIAEIAGDGLTQGGQIADALIHATKGQLKKISQLGAQTRAGANQIGTGVAQDKYGAAIVREVRRTAQAVEKASKDTSLSRKTVDALGRQFKQAAQSANKYVRVSDVDKAEGRRVAALL